MQLLPEGYDPSSDNGRAIVEMFLDEEDPPHVVHVERSPDGGFVVLAEWEDG